MSTNCPNCNSSDSFICEHDEEDNTKKGKSFCKECWDFVKLVPAGEGKEFRKRISKYKKSLRK